METQNYIIIISALTVASLIFIVYLLFFDKNNNEEEINNIYKRIEDNEKMQIQINKDLDSATAPSIQEQLDYN